MSILIMSNSLDNETFTNPVELIILTRYEALKTIRQQTIFFILVGLVVSWFQSNWWLMAFTILFVFLNSAYISYKWSKRLQSITGFEEDKIISIWEAHIQIKK
jgi:glycerol-3-phosphate acyltransferase PlsY